MKERTVIKSKALKELQVIPGVGKSIALNLWQLGIKKVPDLKNKNPNTLYKKFNAISEKRNDICLLYAFRCAVYFATEKKLDKKKLNWWYWKNKIYNG